MSKVNASKKAEQKETTTIDLSKILENVANLDFKEKGNNLSRASLYKYSESELLQIKADKDEGKKIRNKARKRCDFFLFAICGKAKRGEDLTQILSEFHAFYAERFLRNDFSIQSVREESSLDETQKIIFTTAFEIIKAHLAK